MYEDLIEALRVCNNPKGHRCSECPIFSKYEHRYCKGNVDKNAADALEALQKENAELQNQVRALKSTKSALSMLIRGIDGKMVYEKVLPIARKRLAEYEAKYPSAIVTLDESEGK